MVCVKFKIRREKNQSNENVFLFGDGPHLGSWNPQKCIEGHFEQPNDCYELTADLPAGVYYYRYAIGSKCNGKTFLSHCEMDWESNESGSKPARKVTVPENPTAQLTIDDGVLSEKMKYPFLGKNHKRIVLKFTNSNGCPLSENIGSEYSLHVIPSASIALPQLASLNSFSFNNHDFHSISVVEDQEYFHLFTGILQGENEFITLEISNSKDRFVGKITNLDQITQSMSTISVNLEGRVDSKSITLSVQCLIITSLDDYGLMDSRPANNWVKSRPIECGHRGCGNSFNTRNKNREIDPSLMANIRENAINAFTTAHKVGGADMVEFDVTLTKDKVPIIYHDLSVLYNNQPTPIADLTFSQIRTGEVRDMSRKTMSHKLNFDEFSGNDEAHSPTLSDCFEKTSDNLDFNIELKWPLPGEFDNMAYDFQDKDFFDINTYCDKIIDTIRVAKPKRGIVFSSFNPDVCLCLKMKQCDFDVVQLVYGDTGFYPDHHDKRVKRIGWAAAYSKLFGFAGINTIVHDMIKNPEMASRLRNYGLTSGIYGDLLNDLKVRQEMRDLKLDLVIYDNIHVGSSEVCRPALGPISNTGPIKPNSAKSTKAEKRKSASEGVYFGRTRKTSKK